MYVHVGSNPWDAVGNVSHGSNLLSSSLFNSPDLEFLTPFTPSCVCFKHPILQKRLQFLAFDTKKTKQNQSFPKSSSKKALGMSDDFLFGSIFLSWYNLHLNSFHHSCWLFWKQDLIHAKFLYMKNQMWRSYFKKPPFWLHRFDFIRH